MNPEIARKLAETLISRHVPGWSFDFDRSVRRFGACHYSKRKITLSRDLTQRNEVEKVRETILHEIAHARAGYDHNDPASHHGAKWKAECRRLGIPPNRCYSSDDVASKPAPYILRCECGEQQIPRFRQRKSRSISRCCRKPFYFTMNKEVFA